MLNRLVSKSTNYGIMAIVLKDVPSDVPINSPIGMGRIRHDWGSAKEETIRPLNMCL